MRQFQPGRYLHISEILLRMIERGTSGHIVNTASFVDLVAVESGTMYQTSKFAVVGLSESLRSELTPYRIGVSVLCPAAVTTDIMETTRHLGPKSTSKGEIDATARSQIARRTRDTSRE